MKRRWSIELIVEFDEKDEGVDPNHWDWITLLDLVPDQFVKATAREVKNELQDCTVLSGSSGEEPNR